MVVVGTPMAAPKVLRIVLLMVTLSWVAFAPSPTVTVLVPLLSKPLRAATCRARVRALGMSWGR